MDALETLRQRGFVQQITHEEELAEHLANGRVTYYAGFDPTADSLHVGHLLPVMAMTWLQRAGHRPIAVVGGGTAMVGDPSGKTETRQMLTRDTIATNALAMKRQLSQFLDFSDGQGLMADNASWLLELNYIDFLREIGREFSVNRMLSMEAYRLRLEQNQGLSFIEFNYQLLQSYDFLELHRRFGCTLQIGGDDQWGNIVAGSDLIRRKTGERAYGLTQPLITTASGAKMGKTAAGAVWLDPNRLSPFDYYQYWLNIEDADVGRMLKLYTFLDLDRIAELEALSGPAIREAKQVLAFETTRLVHGEEAAHKAVDGAKAMVAGAATADLPSHVLREDTPLVAALADAGLAASRSEARRLVQQGGVKIENEKVGDADFVIALGSLGADGIVVRVGKKKAVRIVGA
ncbi:MAG: tyrosine--tRNA ligase [Alphaproteobacteria bacterium]|nr:tyrosine--tRNA ligase [Alphaproteobacteria bacterium]